MVKEKLGIMSINQIYVAITDSWDDFYKKSDFGSWF
jgi:hypothetical protein